MNQKPSLEQSLQALGAELRSRPRKTQDIMRHVRQVVPIDDSPKRDSSRSKWTPRRRCLITVVAGFLSTMGAAALIVLWLLPQPSIGWEDVAKALRSQEWIRGTRTLAGDEKATMWISPKRETWAFRLGGGTCYFYAGRQRTKYEYRGGNRPIIKLPLGEEDVQKVLPLDAIAQDQGAIGPWLFGTEKIISQRRREISDPDRTWIEFDLVLWRGEANRATLRVDSQTRLPVHLVLRSPEDATKIYKWEFDYPAEGPGDIYALGVARDTKIVDRIPSREALQVLDAMSAGRDRIGDFRLIVSRQGSDLDDVLTSHPAAVVSRKGSRWRIDSCPKHGRPNPPIIRPDGQSWGSWFEARLAENPPNPLYVCDGTAVWKNTNLLPGRRVGDIQFELSRRVAPQDLMSGEGLGTMQLAPNVKFASLIYPDLFPKPGWPFEFDANPAEAPGMVIIKRAAELASAVPLVAHEWYYIDPAKGHAVVRAELFTLPKGEPADPQKTQLRQSIRMENFQKSPEGVWYPTIVWNKQPAARINAQGREVIQSRQYVIRYHFDFDADLPDSLFQIDEPQP